MLTPACEYWLRGSLFIAPACMSVCVLHGWPQLRPAGVRTPPAEAPAEVAAAGARLPQPQQPCLGVLQHAASRPGPLSGCSAGGYTASWDAVKASTVMYRTIKWSAHLRCWV